MGHRDDAVGDLPAVDALMQRRVHRLVYRFEERERHGPEHVRGQLEHDTGIDRARLDPKPNRGEKRIGGFRDDLERGPGRDGSLDTDRRRLAELDVDAELVRQRLPRRTSS